MLKSCNLSGMYFLTLVFIFLFLSVPPLFAEEAGKVMNPGMLNNTRSEVCDMNTLGQDVGWAYTASGEVHAFLWDRDVITDLGTLGGLGSRAFAVNDYGQVVGWAETAAGERHAFIWENGAMEDLGTLGGSMSEALGINDLGQVVGRSETAAGEVHAFIWENGEMIDLNAEGSLSGENYMFPHVKNPLAKGIVFEDDFDTGNTLGDDPVGWDVTEFINAEVEITDESYVSSPYSVKLDNFPGGGINVWHDFTLLSKGTVECYVRSSADGCFISTNEGASDDWGILVAFWNGKIMYLGSSGWGDMDLPFTYTPDTWYHFSFEFDCGTGTYDIYIDDILEKQDAPMKTPSTFFGHIWVSCEYDYVCTAYLDNVVISESDPILVPPGHWLTPRGDYSEPEIAGVP